MRARRSGMAGAAATAWLAGLAIAARAEPPLAVPALAATCAAQPPAKVKGINTLVQLYEVPWLPATAAPAMPGSTQSAAATSNTAAHDTN